MTQLILTDNDGSWQARIKKGRKPAFDREGRKLEAEFQQFEQALEWALEALFPGKLLVIRSEDPDVEPAAAGAPSITLGD